MEKCKFCEAELAEGSSVCPQCGKDNAAEVMEAPTAEPTREKLSAGKSILAVAAVVAVLILLAAVVLNGQKPAASEEPVAMSEEVTEQTEPPTVPADGNPDDVTCKGSYSAADDAVIAAKDTVVATAGDQELTLRQLQVYYWMEVRNFLTQYGAYAAYFGLDYQQGLDTQVCELSETPMTWQQYFLDSALNAWANYSAMGVEADANGFVLSWSQQDTLENVAQELDASALANGFASGMDMVHASLGNAVELEDYKAFMESYYKANGYYNQLADAIRPTAEELEAYFELHADGYEQSGITRDGKLVNVRHILIYPEGADGTNIFTEEFSDEAWAAGEASAQALLDAWANGEKTEESFAALANENSQDPGSNQNGGLYENVTEGEMVQAFNDWCFDAERQVGDTGVVRTEYGYHVMYFSGSRPMWIEYAESDYITEHANDQAAEIAAKAPMTVRYGDILLGNVELT